MESRVELAIVVVIGLLGTSCAKAEEVEKSSGPSSGAGGFESIGGTGGSPFPSGGTTASGGIGASGGSGGAAPCIEGDERSCYFGDPADVGVGVCAPGTQTCLEGAWGDCEGSTTPSAEVCEGSLDENCGGQIDEGCCTKTTYQHDTGLQSGNASVCCDNGDKLVDAKDCGVGDNHTYSVDGNCGKGSEGAGNNGSACVKITCEKEVCGN